MNAQEKPTKRKKMMMGTTSSKEEMKLPVTETLLGVDEATLVTLSEEERAKFVKGGCFVHAKTGNKVSFGTFETPTVEALKERVSRLPPNNKKGTAPVPLTTRSRVDIGELQGYLTTQDRAMVQVASNFNCLENPSRRTAIHGGRLVDKAFQDRTQGPAAVFGTTSCYLYRAHFYGGGQSLGNPVNLLEHTSKYFGTPEVGKLTLGGTELPLKNLEAVDEAMNKVEIGLHTDCPVMFGRSKGRLIDNKIKRAATHGETDVPLEYPLVDHVLNASINVYDFGDERILQPALLNLTRALLRAAYEGIYLAAILRQRRKLFLTLVGGGVFGNPISLIVQEIQKAHAKWASHPASALEEVTICLFSPNDEEKVKAAMKGK